MYFLLHMYSNVSTRQFFFCRGKAKEMIPRMGPLIRRKNNRIIEYKFLEDNSWKKNLLGYAIFLLSSPYTKYDIYLAKLFFCAAEQSFIAFCFLTQLSCKNARLLLNYHILDIYMKTNTSFQR